jgi:hypothetical protein
MDTDLTTDLIMDHFIGKVIDRLFQVIIHMTFIWNQVKNGTSISMTGSNSGDMGGSYAMENEKLCKLISHDLYI